ncbi:P44/Msp2 family outer membrane protein [Anaplasma phagocytophilum]|uniref:p44-new outer membrane protein n=1 Tax=Anaplasma phagocytophilum str. CRT38 TaxID=1269275 RepID=S6G6L3_ANAPH|nr:P44/Msp2 family outer membrane protein [Anaplasma phagocytophilum]EOA62962.1 P44-new outer membrane protein [Anaplasma phagocytophilum str. CRT38]
MGSRSKLLLGSVMMSLAIVMAGQDAKAYGDGSASESSREGYFYVSLDYSPAFSQIRDFSIRDSSDKARAIYPYLNNGDIVKLESNRFDWNTPNPQIGFENNMLVAMEGSVGYGIGNTRVEFEIGYEHFKIRGASCSVSSEDSETDALYLLAREMSHGVVSMQTDGLAAALAKTSGKDFVQFAKAVEISHSDIDGKVCKTKSAGTGQQPCHSGGDKPCSTNAYYQSMTVKSKEQGKTSLCGDSGYSGPEKITGGHNYNPDVFRNFVEKTLLGDGSKNWPTSTGGDTKPNDNAKAVAKDLVNELTPEERTIVAGLLAKIIEGGEVIEIRAISSTSVTMNICSDITISNIVMPYVCVGPGMSFVSVVDGHTATKFAYRLKAGLSYKFSKEVTAFAGGFYHHVIGDGVYDDLPLRHLSDDISPVKHAKETAIARFVMRYFGGEFGVRLAF